jgi:hypothetical protein
MRMTATISSRWAGRLDSAGPCCVADDRRESRASSPATVDGRRHQERRIRTWALPGIRPAAEQESADRARAAPSDEVLLGPPSESDRRHHSTPRPLLSHMESGCSRYCTGDVAGERSARAATPAAPAGSVIALNGRNAAMAVLDNAGTRRRSHARGEAPQPRRRLHRPPGRAPTPRLPAGTSLSRKCPVFRPRAARPSLQAWGRRRAR